MAPEAIAADRAYRLLKADLMSGRFAPATALVERFLASEYGVSVSPLRDGAQRLVGEGMIEIVSTGGYRVPPLSEASLRDLYGWHSHLVRLAIKDLACPMYVETVELPCCGLQEDDAVAQAATALFRSCAENAANEQVANALHTANDRLLAIRLMESRVLDGLSDELHAVTQSMVFSGPVRMNAIWAYHRRRIRRAARIAAVMTNS